MPENKIANMDSTYMNYWKLKQVFKKMNSLVIGDTSQLAQFYPSNYIKISARNIDYDFLLSMKWDRVFICFGVANKNIPDKGLYEDINFKLTLDIINKFKSITNKIVVYSTCELWNKYDGGVDLSMPYNFYNTPYANSKHKLTEYLISNKNEYDNVIILFPFNFNSSFRSNDFLFGKIFNSIINKNKIEIGDTYFYRDLIHPSYVVKVSIETNENKLVGSGRLTFVNDFIRDLYTYYDLSYNSLVIEGRKNFKEYTKINEFYLKSNMCYYPYSELLSKTINDINKKILCKKIKQH